MQIRQLGIYSADGRLRTVDFHTGALNIITGESESGKSAIIEIVRFCLGDEEFRVPVGVIQDKVAWYAIRLRLNDGREAMVARPRPPSGQKSSTAAMLRLGNSAPLPSFDDLSANTTAKAVVRSLGSAIGIDENQAPLSETSSRRAVEATLDHALFFCIQRQDEIASRELLFHRQGEEYVASAIRDVLPYFLGAVPPDYLELLGRLRTARDQLRDEEGRLSRVAAFRTVERDQSVALLLQAEQAGVIEGLRWDELEIADLRAALRKVGDTPIGSSDALLSAGLALRNVRGRQRAAVERYREARETRQLLDTMLAEQDGYAAELDLHRQRMAAATLLPERGDVTECPVCGHTVAQPGPSVRELRDTFDDVRRQAEEAGRDVPRLRRLLASAEQREAAGADEVRELGAALEALAEQEEDVERLGDLLNEQSYVVGRIAHHLDTLAAADDPSVAGTEERIARLRAAIEELEERTSFDSARENTTSILNSIGENMQAWAKRLGLAYADRPVRINRVSLTVVADTASGPVLLKEIGAGKNWVGYHLVAYLALHKFFVQNDRPVPRFIMFDQPSQAFYPPDRRSPRGVLRDADREAVRNMIQLLYDVVAELDPGLQIIVTEHADIDEPWFQQQVLEHWGVGGRLVPDDW